MVSPAVGDWNLYKYDSIFHGNNVMAYGFIAQNDSGQTVINDTEPLYVQKRSGTLSNFGTTDLGYYKFNNSGNSVASGEEIVLYSCDVGKWLSFNIPTSTGFLGEMCSNQSTISYKVFGPRTDLSNPTGYGMAVYNSSGQCVWDAASVVTRIVNAGRIAGSASTSKTYSSGTISGSNAVYCSVGSFIIDWDQGFWQMSARRTGTSSWVLEQRKIYGPLALDIGFTNTYALDLSYILAVT